MLTFDSEEHNAQKDRHKGTDIGVALEYLGRMQKRRCTAFVVSDFYDRKDFEKPLQICSSKHDVMGIQLYDPLLRSLPDVGILRIHDAETGYEQYIDTSNKALRRAHSQYWQERKEVLRNTFQKNSVDYVSISTDEDYVKHLQMMFARR